MGTLRHDHRRTCNGGIVSEPTATNQTEQRFRYGRCLCDVTSGYWYLVTIITARGIAKRMAKAT